MKTQGRAKLIWKEPLTVPPGMAVCVKLLQVDGEPWGARGKPAPEAEQGTSGGGWSQPPQTPPGLNCIIEGGAEAPGSNSLSLLVLWLPHGFF